MVGIPTGQHYQRHHGLVKYSYVKDARKHVESSARKMNSTVQSFVPDKVDVHTIFYDYSHMVFNIVASFRTFAV